MSIRLVCQRLADVVAFHISCHVAFATLDALHAVLELTVPHHRHLNPPQPRARRSTRACPARAVPTLGAPPARISPTTHARATRATRSTAMGSALVSNEIQTDTHSLILPFSVCLCAHTHIRTYAHTHIHICHPNQISFFVAGGQHASRVNQIARVLPNSLHRHQRVLHFRHLAQVQHLRHVHQHARQLQLHLQERLLRQRLHMRW